MCVMGSRKGEKWSILLAIICFLILGKCANLYIICSTNEGSHCTQVQCSTKHRNNYDRHSHLNTWNLAHNYISAESASPLLCIWKKWLVLMLQKFWSSWASVHRRSLLHCQKEREKTEMQNNALYFEERRIP